MRIRIDFERGEEARWHCYRRARIREVLRRDLVEFDSYVIASARLDEIARNIEKVL